jgi:DNA-binding HxlR family transcriptional regulator
MADHGPRSASTPDGPTENDPLPQLIGLLARRHCLALVRELHGGPQPFAVLARSAGAAQPAASQRLKELRAAGIVEIDESGDYRLTTWGRRLEGALDSLADFAEPWSRLTPRQRHPRGSWSQGRGET